MHYSYGMKNLGSWQHDLLALWTTELACSAGKWQNICFKLKKENTTLFKSFCMFLFYLKSPVFWKPQSTESPLLWGTLQITKERFLFSLAHLIVVIHYKTCICKLLSNCQNSRHFFKRHSDKFLSVMHLSRLYPPPSQQKSKYSWFCFEINAPRHLCV